MSLFGDTLKALIDANEINIYGMAKSAGIERTVIHKIISDGRMPSDEYARKLADALQLSPEERKRFWDSYSISKIGELKHAQRIQVKKLIESVAHFENSDKICEYSPLHQAASISINTTAIGHFAVNNLIKGVMEELIAAQAPQKIDFVIPVGFQFFYDELLSGYLHCPSLNIRHIIALMKRSQFADNFNENLKSLAYILPLAFAPGAKYFPHYVYRMSTEPESSQIMPYFMLTSTNKLITFSDEFDRAALICDRDIVALYQERFLHALEQATPLIKYFTTIAEVLAHCIDSDIAVDTPYHWIEPEPCVGPLSTAQMIDAKLKRDLPNRADILQMVCTHYGFLAQNQLKNINVCTTDGLYRMRNSGLIYNVPLEFIEPLTPEEFKELLVILRNRINSDKVKVLFTNPSKITIPRETLLQINKKAGIHFIGFNNATSDCRAVCICEANINEAFSDFVESMEESGLVYDAKASLDILNSVINDME